MDDDICTLINLSIYLESYLEQHPHAHYMFTEETGLGVTKRLKNRYSGWLKQTWLTDEWKSMIDESDRGKKVGSHSQRKWPATYASNKGCTQPEIEVRGRWQGEGANKVVNVYIDRQQEYTDAKVAAALCIGGILPLPKC